MRLTPPLDDDEIGPVDSTNVVNGAHKSDGNDGDEHENIVARGVL